MANPPQETENERIAKLRPSSDAAACIEAGKELNAVQFSNAPNGIPLIALKDGWKVEQHPELVTLPPRHSGTLTLADIDSFCRYFKKYKDDDSIILVDSDPEGKRGATFVGILNYHSVDGPDHGDFRVQYTAKLSVEWTKWMSMNAVAMRHEQFLEHLDNVKGLIKEPDSAGLLELIGNLEGKVNARFDNAKNLHNGSMKLSYSEDVQLTAGSAGERKSEMVVPEMIVAGLPVFEFGTPYRVECKLRYRVQNRALTFGYEAVDTHLIVKDAVKDQVARVNELTGTEPMFGTPPTK
jgi:uncharacterized protein YfdQ (DUF2303 family)